MDRMFTNECFELKANHLFKFGNKNISNKVVTVQPMKYEPIIYLT